MSDDILQIETIGEIQRVTLNRPDRLNAINHPMAEQLLAYFEARRRDTNTRVIIVRGAGRGFTAGADLKAMGQPDMLRDGPNGDWVLRDTMNAMRACPQCRSTASKAISATRWVLPASLKPRFSWKACGAACCFPRGDTKSTA